MLKLLAVASLLFAACDDPKRAEPKDAPADQPAPADAYVEIDAPPPSVDAGPPPAMACSARAPTCELPPSTCLDAHYLVYYTAGTCVGDMCQYTTNLLYCDRGCVNDGCVPAFT